VRQYAVPCPSFENYGNSASNGSTTGHLIRSHVSRRGASKPGSFSWARGHPTESVVGLGANRDAPVFPPTAVTG